MIFPNQIVSCDLLIVNYLTQSESRMPIYQSLHLWFLALTLIVNDKITKENITNTIQQAQLIAFHHIQARQKISR